MTTKIVAGSKCSETGRRIVALLNRLNDEIEEGKLEELEYVALVASAIVARQLPQVQVARAVRESQMALVAALNAMRTAAEQVAEVN